MFCKFISSSKARYRSNTSVLKPIQYIENIYNSLKRQNSVDKIENSHFIELLRATQHVIDDREAADDDNIYPCLLNLAQYLVGVLKSVPRTKIKLKPIEPIKEQQESPFDGNQIETTTEIQVPTNGHVEKLVLAKAESPTKEIDEPKLQVPVVEEERHTDAEMCVGSELIAESAESKPDSDKIAENDEESEDDEEDTVVPKQAEPLDEAKELKILARIKKIDEFCQVSRVCTQISNGDRFKSSFFKEGQCQNKRVWAEGGQHGWAGFKKVQLLQGEPAKAALQRGEWRLIGDDKLLSKTIYHIWTIQKGLSKVGEYVQEISSLGGDGCRAQACLGRSIQEQVQIQT